MTRGARRTDAWRERGLTWAAEREERMARHPAGARALAIGVLVRDTEARDRVLVIAAQAFLAVIPLMMILATTLGSGDGGVGIAERLNERVGLTGTAADAVVLLFGRPPGATGGVTAFSVLLLLFSLNSLARQLQRTYESAWGLSRRGAKGFVDRLGGMVVLGLGGTAAAYIGGMARTIVTDIGEAVAGEVGVAMPRILVGLVALAVQVAVLVAVWAIATRWLLNRRVGWRRVFPGAVATAVIQLAAGWATAIYLPLLFARNAERYGVIGVALALVAWLIALAAVIVASAIVGAAMGRPELRDDPRPLRDFVAADRAARAEPGPLAEERAGPPPGHG